MATVHTDQKATVNRGSVPALNPKIGMIEKQVTIGGLVGPAASDAVAVFQFTRRTHVIAAGFEVVTPTTNAITASLGVGGGGGSCTGLLGESATNGAAGTHFSGVAQLGIAAADCLDIEVSADAGAAGAVRVWALIADIEDMDAEDVV